MKEIIQNLSREQVKKNLTRIEPQESYSDKIALELGKIVFSQQEACKSVGRRLSMFEAGIGNPDKPLGSMFFLGVSGSGKTEMAHAVAEYMFGDPKSDRLKIINMGEFKEPHTVMKLTGSPPSYVGYDETPAIPHSWLHKSRTVIVFDEIEKSHPAVRDVLLSILDKGRIDARNGKNGSQPLNFSNSLIIFTSNVGAVGMHKVTEGRAGCGFISQNIDKEVEISRIAEKEIKKHFSPEFMNRIDDVVVFQELRDRETYGKIIDKFLQQRNKNMTDTRGIYATFVSVTKEFKAFIIDRTDNNGGRECARVLDKELFDKAVDPMLAMDLRGKPLVADRENGKTEFYTDDSLPNIEPYITNDPPDPPKKRGSSPSMDRLMGKQPADTDTPTVKKQAPKAPSGFIPEKEDKPDGCGGGCGKCGGCEKEDDGNRTIDIFIAIKKDGVAKMGQMIKDFPMIILPDKDE